MCLSLKKISEDFCVGVALTFKFETSSTQHKRLVEKY